MTPAAPNYFFMLQDMDLSAEYEQGWRMSEAVPINVLGFQTHRDHFAIDIDERRLRDRIEELRNPHMSDEDLRTTYSLTDNPAWQLATVRRQLRNDLDWERHFIRCLYRPFDWRWCSLNRVATDRPRRELIEHVAGRENLTLNLTRQTKAETWQHAVIANAPTPALYVEIKDGSNAFPLYLYPTATKTHLFDGDAPTDTPGGRRANLAPAFVQEFAGRLGLRFVPDGKGDLITTFGPEDVFHYMYAVFHSPTYRSRYAEFLKIDFPRLPLTSNVALFRELCGLGGRLVGLHLMETSGSPMPTYPEDGTNIVEAIRYTQPNVDTPGRVWINKTQYFEGVTPEVWEFHVGGYQVCAKWLKDRKGRTLAYDDLLHYERVCAALAETSQRMTAIDMMIEENGGFPFA